MSDFPDDPYAVMTGGRMAELKRHEENVHAHFSGIWKLGTATRLEAFDLGTSIQAELRECRRLIDEIVSRGEHASADELWLNIGLWPGADNRPFLGDAADALASLSPETIAALESGQESVKQGRPELRLTWEEAVVKRGTAGAAGTETTKESRRDAVEKLLSEGYTQAQIAQQFGKTDRTVRRWLNGK